MAGRADFEVQLGFGRLGLERVAARAADLDLLILGVNPFLHVVLPLGAPSVVGAALRRPNRAKCKWKLYTRAAGLRGHYAGLSDGKRLIRHEFRRNCRTQVSRVVAACLVR